MALEKASRKRVKLRAAVVGPSGSGKTATALMLATALARRYGKDYKNGIAVIDTQKGQSLDYADTRFAPDGFDIDVLDASTSVEKVQGAVSKIVAAGYCVLVIDTFTSVWAGTGGVLEVAGASGKQVAFNEWSGLKAPLKKLVGQLQGAPLHLVVTMRAKTDWYVRKETNDKGKEVNVPSKVGTTPEHMKGIEYEFSTFLHMDEFNTMTVGRTSFEAWNRLQIDKPGIETFTPLLEWMDEGKANTATAGVVGKAASPTQVREYFELQLRLKGRPEEEVLKLFAAKYGAKPSDMSEEFMDERLDEVRGLMAVAREKELKEAAARLALLNGAKTPANSDTATADGSVVDQVL